MARFRPLTLLVGACLLFAGCVQSAAPASTNASTDSVLASSTPASGSTVAGPVEELAFRFSMPVRLMEVTVRGPDGLMPLMITPAGETKVYSMPIAGLEAGSYSVDWRATSVGSEYRGSYSFTVK